MDKIIAFIMAIVTLLGQLVPNFMSSQVKGVTTGAWLEMINKEFSMSANTYSATPHYADITSTNKYFATVQIAYEWKVITADDKDTVNKDGLLLDVTNQFVATTLVRVAQLQLKDAVVINNAKKLSNPAEVATAVSNGLFKLDWLGNFKVKTISLDDAKALLAKVKEMWANKSFGAPAVVQATPDVVNFSGDFEPALETAQIKVGESDKTGAVLQDAYVPLNSAEGITQSQLDIASLLKKLDVSFSLGKFDFGLKVTETGFNLDIGADICDGVKLAKSYEITNLNVSTKFDGNLATKDIKEAYIRADYDLKDVTTLTGNYAASVAVDPSKLPAGSPTDFMAAAKAGALALMPGGGNKITVFSVQVPIPNCPAITISLDVNICITVDGKIQITITSSNVKGVEIINNKVRVINETIYGQQTYDIMANVKFTVGLDLGIRVLGYMVVDAEFDVGVGIRVTAKIECDTAVYTPSFDMPLDLAIAIPYPTNTMDNATFCGNAKIYGLMSVSVGQNSPLLKLIGVNKTWVIFDESNAVIYNLHIEETGIVDECTRARTA